MQRILLFLPVLLIVSLHYDSANAVVTDGMDRHESEQILRYFQQDNEWRARELKKIEADMKQLNPELVEQLANSSDNVKLAEYKSWLAQKTFQEFYDKYMNELKQVSQQSGRAIVERDRLKGKKRGDWTSTEYKLSDKDIRTDCHIAPDYGDTLCYYPDGYVEFEIVYNEDSASGSRQLTVTKDVPGDNRTSFYNFSLTQRDFTKTTEDNTDYIYTNSYMFGYTAVDQEYDKMHQFRNDSVRDLLAGKCYVDCKDCLVDGNTITTFTCDTNSKLYKSSRVPPSVGINYVQHYTAHYTKAETQ